MQIKSLKIYCDTVQLRSFSKAAELNGVSQSSASQAVNHLEERLGLQLIDRSKRPFVLTPEGEHYYDGCRGLVRRYYDLEREVQTLHEAVASRLVIAAIYSVGLAHMSGYVKEFTAQHPKADLHLEYSHPDKVYQLVESGEADLGVVSYPARSRKLNAVAWREEAFVLVSAPDHPLAKEISAPLSVLNGEPMVAFQSGLRVREEIDRVLVRHKVEPAVALEFDNVETMKRAIEIGDGVSLLPEPTVAAEVESGRLVKIPIEGPTIVRPLGLIYRRDHALTETTQKFVELLLSHQDDPEFQSAASNDGTNGQEELSSSKFNSSKRNPSKQSTSV